MSVVVWARSRKELFKRLRDEVPAFAKAAAPVFDTNDWTWWFERGKVSCHIPNEQEIANVCLSLLQSLWKNRKKCPDEFSSGRIAVMSEHTINLDWRGEIRLTCEQDPREQEQDPRTAFLLQEDDPYE